MEDYTASYERLLSSQGGGGGGSPSYRHPPPRPTVASPAAAAGTGTVGPTAPPVFGEIHARIPTVSASVDPAYPGRFMANGTGSLPFLGSLYGTTGSVGTPGSSPLGGPPSPYRSGTVAGNGLVNTRTFWPPTPPPEGGGYYPMFSSMSPMASSDLTFSCGSLLPRLPSPANPFMHLLSNHKETPFLPLRLNSPVTSTHPLSVPPVPYLHLPTPSLDHRYPTTPGLFSPLSLHNIQSGLQDLPKAKLADLDVKPSEKVIKSEPPSLSTSFDKEQPLLVVNNVEASESGKRSKSLPKVASVKAREKHDAKKEEQKKLPVLCSSQYRKVSPTIPVMTATVLPCNVSPSCSTLKSEPPSVKCSKCSASVEENCKKEKQATEESKLSAKETGDCITMNTSQNVSVPVSQVTVTSAASTTAVTVTSTVATTTSSAGNTLTSQNVKANTPESVNKPVTPSPTVLETAPSPQAMKLLPTPQPAVRKAQSPAKSLSPTLPSKKGPTEETKSGVLGSPANGHANCSQVVTVPVSSPVLTSVGGSVESHVSAVCSFSSWVHHQTSVTSVIKQDHPESDSCLHSVQSQMTVVNLSMDKGVVDSPKTSQVAKSESTLIFQMQNTHNAQQVKCHQRSESTEEINCSLLNQNQNKSSKCGVKELSVDKTVHISELPAEKKVVTLKDLPRENAVCVKELSADKCGWGRDSSALQQQAINLSVDRSKLSEKDCPSTAVQQKSVNCDIKKATEATATQCLDSLTRLARSPSGPVIAAVASGQNNSWNAPTNKIKPSSVVSSIQSETLQMTSAIKKPAVDHTPSTSLAEPVVSISGATRCVSSPSSQRVHSELKSEPTVVKMREVNSNVSKEESKITKVCSILPTHEPSTSSAMCTTITNPITNTSVQSSIPVGIAVAQLRHDSSTVSIKKAVVKANSMDNKTSIPAIIDKGDKRFIKTSITTAADTTMIVNPTPTLSQWDGSSAVVRPATLSGSWLAPAPSVVTPTVWLGSSYQGATAQPAPCISQALGSLVEAAPAATNGLAPPVGYHLARDPLTGHLFLIPAPNIDIVDRPSVWSTYSPNPVQQVISHFPTTINGTKKELKPILTAPQIIEKPELPVIQPRLIQSTDQPLAQEIKDIKSLNTAVQSSVTSITVQTGQPFAFPSFTTTPQPALSYFYDQPTIVHIAQTQTAAAPSLPTVTQVQAEPGKRSQGTSPLNSMTPSPPPQTCLQVSEYESDAESLQGSETSNKASVGVTASCQVDMDACSSNSNDVEYEERTVEVFDSANQTDNMLLDSLKEEPEDVSPVTLVMREDHEVEEDKQPDFDSVPDVKQETKLDEEEEEQEEEPKIPELAINSNTNNNFQTEEEELAAPILPTESKPVIDFIDQHGLNLLVDSIEEFASREQKGASQNLISINSTSRTEVEPTSEPFDSVMKPQLDTFSGIESGCTDGLGLLCALAEQRFLEESKNCEEDERTVALNRARSCSPDMPYRLQGSQTTCRRQSGTSSARPGSLSNSRCQSPVLLNPAELEMRFKLAELQRKYKIKQKELAKLKAKKDRDHSSSEGSAPHLHMPPMREYVEEGTRKKKSKGPTTHIAFVDTPVPSQRNSMEASGKMINTGGCDLLLDNIEDKVHVPEQILIPSPVRTTNSFTVSQHSEKAHQAFPNLLKITTTKKELESKVVSSNFRGTVCKLKTTNKKKTEKRGNNNIFQLWKEKKLEELSRVTSGKPHVPPVKVKTIVSEVKPLSKNPEQPVKVKDPVPTATAPSGKVESNIMTDCPEVKNETLKRKAEPEKIERNSEISEENVKRPKLETQEHSVEEQELTVKKDEEPVCEEGGRSDEKEEIQSGQNTEQAPKAKKREKRSSCSDDVWSRRRSERIFLHDAGVILPSSLTYTSSQTSNNNNNNNSPSGSKSPRSPEPPKKKMTRKELGLKKLKFKEAEKQNQVPMEMFLALRQCRLNEMGFTNNMGVLTGVNRPHNATSSQDDSSGSEGDLPLSLLLQADRRHFFVPELPPCQMHVSDLRDCQRVLMEEDGLYYAGYITAIQAPDVYGITLDRERGNRPHIFSREEMLEQTVKEVKPIHVKQIPEGTRVCAYWSQQYRCLYPGTVTKGNSEEPTQEKNTVFVEFDDGDSGRIPLEDVRLLLPDPNYEPPDSNNEEKEDNAKDEAMTDADVSTPGTEKSQSQTDDNTLKGQPGENVEVENPLPATKLQIKCKAGKNGKVKVGKNKSGVKDSSKADGKSQTKKAKKAKSKSDKGAKTKSEEKLKAKSEKIKKKGLKSNQEKSVISLDSGLNTKTAAMENQDEESNLQSSQLVDENGNCIKPKKTKKSTKLEVKKLSKLKNSAFMLKKGKHHFADASSITEKIKSLKKSHKNKSEGKNKTKPDKLSGDCTKLEGGECKVKKRKKHKTDHKHHHHHHKHHCHHHHKKHKRKSEPLDLLSAGSPVLTINVGPEPKGSLLANGEESKVEMPICCVSPGRSELSVKIKSSPPSSSSSLVKSPETVLPVVEPKKKDEVNLKESSKQNNAFSFPEKGSSKNNEKSLPLKAESDNKEASNESKSPKKRKERKISCEKSKIAAFLPARQLWRWSGKSFKRPGTKGKAKKEYFKAITRGKETIKVGDCAVFLSTGRPHLPYVGSIETMWQSWGGNTVVKVKWFYHPEETKGGKKLAHPKGALFQSPHVDENDVQTISHKCEVLSWSEYQKWCEKRAASGKSNYENEDVYYLAGHYEPLTKVLTLEPGVS